MDRDEPPSKSPSLTPPRWLLVSDVDDTLVGDEQALDHFLAAIDGLTNFRLALNSSRPIASIQRTLHDLPQTVRPAAIIGAMGTEISIGGAVDRQWTKRFMSFNREPIDDVMRDLGCPPHDDEMQTPFKASFAVPMDRRQDVLDAIEQTGVRCRIIRSGESDFDVLPENAGKGHATLYVADVFDVSPRQMIVAGDSGNDLAMFDIATLGIIVGNARDELRTAIDHRAVNAGGDFYFAVYPRAAGLLEGLQHFGVPVKVPSST